MATVTSVDTTPDPRHAKVYFTVLVTMRQRPMRSRARAALQPGQGGGRDPDEAYPGTGLRIRRIDRVGNESTPCWPKAKPGGLVANFPLPPPARGEGGSEETATDQGRKQKFL